MPPPHRSATQLLISLEWNFNTKHPPAHPPPKTHLRFFKCPIKHNWWWDCEIPQSPNSHIFPAHYHYHHVITTLSIVASVMMSVLLFLYPEPWKDLLQWLPNMYFMRSIWLNVCHCSNEGVNQWTDAQLYESCQWQCIPVKQNSTHLSIPLIFIFHHSFTTVHLTSQDVFIQPDPVFMISSYIVLFSFCLFHSLAYFFLSCILHASAASPSCLSVLAWVSLALPPPACTLCWLDQLFHLNLPWQPQPVA